MSEVNKKMTYLNYLPEMLRNTKEFQGIAQIEDTILLQEALAKERLLQDQWILTASKEGLLRRAKMLGIAEKQGETLEALRQRVLFRWNGRCPYTYTTLLEWLDGLCGEGNYTETLSYPQYTLEIVLELRKKELQKEIYDVVRYMIPANMILKVLIRYNQYGSIRKISYGRLRKWSYGEIKEEDFKSF